MYSFVIIVTFVSNCYYNIIILIKFTHNRTVLDRIMIAVLINFICLICIHY